MDARRTSITYVFRTESFLSRSIFAEPSRPLSDSEYDPVVAAIKESHLKLRFLFLGDVLMPDLCHALIWPVSPLTISRVVQDVQWISARSLNRRRHTVGPVGQHKFWDRFVRPAQEFRERLDYMHLNPVRKGFVKPRHALCVVGFSVSRDMIPPNRNKKDSIRKTQPMDMRHAYILCPPSAT
jgi:REP element-mobilizing transposase RayT